MRRTIVLLSAGLVAATVSAASAQNATPRNLILFVPDGLRGRIVTPQTAPAMAEAREKAVADASTQAEELAGLAEVELGEIQSISMYGGSPTPFYGGRGGDVAQSEGALSVPISPGQFVVSVDVSIVFEIQ